MSQKPIGFRTSRKKRGRKGCPRSHVYPIFEKTGKAYRPPPMTIRQTQGIARTQPVAVSSWVQYAKDLEEEREIKRLIGLTESKSLTTRTLAKKELADKFPAVYAHLENKVAPVVTIAPRKATRLEKVEMGVGIAKGLAGTAEAIERARLAKLRRKTLEREEEAKKTAESITYHKRKELEGKTPVKTMEEKTKTFVEAYHESKKKKREEKIATARIRKGVEEQEDIETIQETTKEKRAKEAKKEKETLEIKARKKRK